MFCISATLFRKFWLSSFEIFSGIQGVDDAAGPPPPGDDDDDDER